MNPFEQISLEIEVCKMNVRSGFRLHPRVLSLRRLFFIEFKIKSARKFVVEPPMTVDLSFCSAAFLDVSPDPDCLTSFLVLRPRKSSPRCFLGNCLRACDDPLQADIRADG